jgi:hypothetical protein
VKPTHDDETVMNGAPNFGYGPPALRLYMHSPDALLVVVSINGSITESLYIDFRILIANQREEGIGR